MTSYATAGPRRQGSAIWVAVMVLGLGWVGLQIANGGSMLRVVVSVAVMGVLAVPAMQDPRRAVFGLFIVLPFLGMIRHMFLSATGAPYLDPLLLITSAVTIVLVVSMTLNKQMDFEGTLLAKLVFLLLIVGLIQVFNPYQGSFLVGLTGIMINLVPIAFFFIGRSLGDAEFARKIVRVVLVVGVLGALYGLVQVFVGFRGFELDWLATQGYTAGTVAGTKRPFSFFNNSSEYAAYAQIAFTVALASLLFAPKAKRTFLMAAVALLAYAGFLIGSRGFTIKIGLAVIVLLAARARNRALAIGVATLLAGVAVLWSASTTTTGSIQDKEEGAAQLVEQQLQALRDPFNRNVSTLPIHFEQAVDAIRFGVGKWPFGLGTGAPTRGAAKFGGLKASSEVDIADAFLAYGVIGGGLFVVIILGAITTASRVRRALPGPVWVGIWALLLTSIGAWLIGGNYAIGPLVWFLMGSADAAYKRLRDRGLLGGTLPA